MDYRSTQPTRLEDAAAEIEMGVSCLQDAERKLYDCDPWLHRQADEALRAATSLQTQVNFTLTHPDN